VEAVVGSWVFCGLCGDGCAGWRWGFGQSGGGDRSTPKSSLLHRSGRPMRLRPLPTFDDAVRARAADRRPRWPRDSELVAHIKAGTHRELGVYGSRKVWLGASWRRVARSVRLMKQLGLQGVRRAKVKRTTVADSAAVLPANWCAVTFVRPRRTRCGWTTLPMCRRGRDRCRSHSSSMPRRG
jgi:hypothetical protein